MFNLLQGDRIGASLSYPEAIHGLMKRFAASEFAIRAVRPPKAKALVAVVTVKMEH
jgi:hypothetical protein